MRALMNLSIPVPSREKQKLLSKFLSILFEYEALIQRESELLSIIKNRIVENQMRG
jgi:CRISPR/Cas system-associated protein endoribonuclease Cas2